jgi:hypothetical protein
VAHLSCAVTVLLLLHFKDLEDFGVGLCAHRQSNKAQAERTWRVCFMRTRIRWGVKRPRWVRGQERTFPASAGMSSGGVAFAIASEQIRQALVGSLQVMQ